MCVAQQHLTCLVGINPKGPTVLRRPRCVCLEKLIRDEMWDLIDIRMNGLIRDVSMGRHSLLVDLHPWNTRWSVSGHHGVLQSLKGRPYYVACSTHLFKRWSVRSNAVMNHYDRADSI